MSLWTEFKNKMNNGEPVTLVWARDHTVEVLPCVIDPALNLVRDGKGRSWPKPSFDPKPAGKEQLYLALGEVIVPWPTREQPSYDVDDEGKRIEITPELLDQLTRDSDTEAWLRGVRGISMWERITHIGLGAAGGMILTFLLIKLIGFASSKTSGGPATSVTITNASTNATALAPAIMLHATHLATILHGAWTF